MKITKNQINGYRRSVTDEEIDWGLVQLREGLAKKDEKDETMAKRDSREVSQE